MTKFEKIQPGDSAELKHIVSENDIQKFVDLTGDDNKIHVDKDYASQTPLKKNVAHGMLGASFLSTVIGTKLPGDGALWLSQSLEFLLPIRIGDEITIKAEVIKKLAHENIIELKTDIFNQSNQKVTTGKAKVKIIEPVITEPEKEIRRAEKIALVIGGSGGIGRSACLSLAKKGFHLIIHYNSNEEAAKEVKRQVESFNCKALLVKADILNEKDIDDIFEKIARNFDHITVLVNCAITKLHYAKFAELKWEKIQEQFEINIKSNFNLIKKVLPFMEKQNYGKIINITTLNIETVQPEMLPYIIAKSALKGFSKSLALELGPKGIRVNMVSPGLTETELTANIPQKTKLVMEAKIPLKRLARTEDIANTICFLASEESDFLNGETIRVNGGQSMI